MIGLTRVEIKDYKLWMREIFGIDAKEIESWETSGELDFTDLLDNKLQNIDLEKLPFEISHKKHTSDKQVVCKSPFEHAHIAWNGNVLFCTDFYDFSAGNVKEDTLENIFFNERSETFRREIENNSCSSCNHCSWRMS
jgi:sulfatase maturation enzyme AslB (radical SAM superfamily)